MIGEFVKERERYQYYASFLKENIERVMLDIEDFGLESIFAPILYQMTEEEQENFVDYVKEITNRFLYAFQNTTTRMTMRTATNQLVGVYEECFADLMSILLLKLTPEEYLNMLTSNAVEQGAKRENIAEYDYVFRALLVTICMLTPDDEVYKWNPEQLAMIGSETLAGKVVLEMAVLYQVYVVNGKDIYSTDKYLNDDINIFRDSYVIRQITEYLRACRTDFTIQEKQRGEDEDKKEKENAEILTQIRTMHKELNEKVKNIEFRMIEQLAFIHAYKNDLFSETEEK